MADLISDEDINNLLNFGMSNDVSNDDDMLGSDDIDALLNSIDDDKEDNNYKPVKMGPFHLFLDFKYKNTLSKINLNNIKNMFSKIMENYVRKIREIKKLQDFSVIEMTWSLVKPSEIENYFNFENLNIENINKEPIIKNYKVNNSPIYLETVTGLINLILDRELTKPKDKITDYSAELYLFSLFESYFNQISATKIIPDQDQNKDLYKQVKKDELYLIIEIYVGYEDELIPLSLIMPKETYIQYCDNSNTEITIHSNDYYKKREAMAVVSGTKIEDNLINSLNEGSVITFPINDNNYLDLVINNNLKAKGICGTYRNLDLNARLEIKEKIDNEDNNYFTSDINAFLIFATADGKKALQQLEYYTPDADTQIILDTEINISTLLLVVNSKIIGTVEVTEKNNELKATVRKLLQNPIEII